jgi:hypothetical protein
MTATQAASPFLATIRAAQADGLLVKITERVNGRRYRYEHHYPAKRIERIAERPRVGAEVVCTDNTRIRVGNIIEISVEAGT